MCYVGVMAGKGGATNGMLRGMQVGFELLGVVYGWWGGGCAAQLMLAKATWAPPPHPCLFYGAECALNAAKGSDESDVALEDVCAGLRADLVCGTHPDGTHNETDRDRGQGGGAGRDGIEVGLTSRKWTLLRHKGGVLDRGATNVRRACSN